MSIVENIQAQLDNSHFVAIVSVDLRKAFDMVDYKNKLKNFKTMV